MTKHLITYLEHWQNCHLFIQVRNLLAGVSQEAIHYIVNKYRYKASFID